MLTTGPLPRPSLIYVRFFKKHKQSILVGSQWDSYLGLTSNGAMGLTTRPPPLFKSNYNVTKKLQAFGLQSTSVDMTLVFSHSSLSLNFLNNFGTRYKFLPFLSSSPLRWHLFVGSQN